jgi:hypothetical protein
MDHSGGLSVALGHDADVEATRILIIAASEE